jgi:HK97 family phage major capsid protein
MYAKELREKWARLGAEIQTMSDLLKKEDRGFKDSAEREKFHALETEFTKLEDQIKAVEKAAGIENLLKQVEDGTVRIDETNIDQIRAEFRLSPGERRQRENEKDPHAKNFATYLRMGMERSPGEVHAALRGFSAGINNAMSTTTGSQGGYLIPQGFSGSLEEAKKWFGGISGTVNKFTTGSGNPFPWPTINDTTNKGRIIGQNVQVVETDLTFGQVTFQAYIGSSDLILIPLALIEDSYFDMEALAARLLGIRLGRLYNLKCTVGTGTGEPTGIVTAAVTAGNVTQLGTGNTASIAYNNLVDLQHSVDPAYRENDSSKWMFSDTMLKLLKKLVDGNNRPLWQPSLTSSFQQGAAVMTGYKPQILGNEYVVNQDMAIPGASAYSVLFGDMSAFKVREVNGGTTVLVLRERYADSLQLGMTAFQRFDSNLVDAGTHPLAVLQQSAT